MPPEEALQLWDATSTAKWPRGADPLTEINGKPIDFIATEAHAVLMDVWGRSALRRASPRLCMDKRSRLEAVIPDLDAVIASGPEAARDRFCALRDLVGWVIDRPREDADGHGERQSR